MSESMSSSKATSRASSPTPAEPLYGGGQQRRITIRDLQVAKERGERWPMLTAYDAITARIFDDAGVPVLLVGDSAANVVYGYSSTIPVTMDEMVPLVAAVARSTKRALIVADMPFGSYQSSPEQALEQAARFMKEGHAHAVKLEGGQRVVPQVEALVNAGIPVMGHLGLTPQSVNTMGGYRVQGRGGSGEMLLHDAKALEAAGVFALVLEVVPADLADRVTAAIGVPTIGIGAGAGCDAQVNVWQDLVGLAPAPSAKFVKRYAEVGTVVSDAVKAWSSDVVSGTYPGPDNTYS